MNRHRTQRIEPLSDPDIVTAETRSKSDPLVAAVLRRSIDRAELAAAIVDTPRFALARSAALDRCLSPLRVEELARAWGSTPLHVHRPDDPDRFSGLLSLEHLDALLAEGRIPRETIFALDAKRPSQREFEALPDDTELGIDLTADGTSLYFHLIDQFSPRLRAFCDELETALALPVCAFAFLTPPMAQARRLHWDPLDVLVLQVEGEKVWDVHAPLVSLPLAEHDSRDYTFATPRVARVKLGAGDTLYVPRGFIHKASSTKKGSLSITIGVRSLVWQHVIVEATKAVSRCTTATKREDFLAEVREHVRLDVLQERALNEPRPMAAPSFPMPHGYISVAFLDDEALAALRFGRTNAPFHLRVRGQRADLLHRGCGISLRADALCAFHFVAERRQFRADEFIAAFRLPRARALLQQFVSIGFIALLPTK